MRNFNYFFLLIISFFLISCTRNTSTSISNNDNCRLISHQMGETRVCGEPKRIIALGPYLLEPLVALQVQPIAFGDHIAFYTKDYTNPSQQIPYLGKYINQPIANVGIAYTPNIEQILKVKPDLILGIKDNNASQYETLSKIAPTIILDWDKPEENMRTIAQGVNRETQAEKVLQETQAKIIKTKTEFAPVVEKHPKVLLLYAQGLQELISNHSKGLCNSLIEDLGFELVSPPKSNPSQSDSRTPISLEILPQLDKADSIILLGYNFSQPETLKDMDNFAQHQLTNLQQEWAKNPITQSLSASKEGRVYYIPAYMCLGLTGSIGTELYLNELKKQLLPKL
ncbi:iron-siderophore ABC transporter substrate-binding protein [Geminocystis sp. GBBB08]|uniref:iron-siderophore ABC transporter substrate-binding protein n=1 Tax=Geminocystis sp. GBBB08 TaxID=2604140 RepID=UPI0027E34024|nr:iron-siderophore ABC transporter substrate-binding protein [Geminocystis sp. GBBB08]MBL1210204.1 iron-siderophore ABC transporter substrate-binding protein [Geminocystis sp. GBBB08]